ncbi:MAG: hypothetical protein WA917_04575 [Comamonas sp.]
MAAELPVNFSKGTFMQIKDVRLESFTVQIQCDRCDVLAEDGEVDFSEMASIHIKAGYGSIFGDGNDVQVDLCQHCLKLALGQWLRVTNPAQEEVSLQRRLDLSNSDRHGGEFPAKADASLQVPRDMPVQERRSLDDDVQT